MIKMCKANHPKLIRFCVRQNVVSFLNGDRMTSEQQGDIIVDGEVEMLLYSPTCFSCLHWHLNEERTCNAFPRGIPEVIWVGENDHKAPFIGDRGIRFEELTPQQREERRDPIADALFHSTLV